MKRPIIDAGVLVALERGGTALAQTIPDDADLAVAAVTAAELLLGVALADDQGRPRRMASVEALLAAIPVIRYDLTVARERPPARSRPPLGNLMARMSSRSPPPQPKPAAPSSPPKPTPSTASQASTSPVVG